jgi:hypothetical protein
MTLCFPERGQQYIELLQRADFWKSNWRLEDFGFLDEMDAFLGRREHFGRSRITSRGNPVFDVFGTEDIETINTPNGLYLVKSPVL